jgi:hypothetical protein
MKSKLAIRLGIALAIVAVLVSAAIIPAFAASTPVITVTNVAPGSFVTFRVDNMPVNVKMAVTMGPAGSAGIGSMVAHIVSGVGGTQTFMVEILSDLRNANQIVVRIDSGTGLAAYTTFTNVAYSAPAATAVPTTVATAVPTTVFGTGGAITSGTTTLRAVHVQKGGWVQVLFTNLPLSTSFSVTVGASGSKGVGGYLVGHMKTGSNGPTTATGTFEIPFPLRSNSTLDIRFDSGSYVYVLTFNNVEY